jgi:chromosome segregation ATPase
VSKTYLDGKLSFNQEELLGNLRELRAIGRQQIIALNNERNRLTALEREHAKNRSIVEQMLGEALANLDNLRAECQLAGNRLEEAETRNAALRDEIASLRVTNQRLLTKQAALRLFLLAKPREFNNTRHDIQTLIGEPSDDVRSVSEWPDPLSDEAHDLEFQSKTFEFSVDSRAQSQREHELADEIIRLRAELAQHLTLIQIAQQSLADTQQTHAEKIAEFSNSRWLRLGRALGFAKWSEV